MGWVTDRHPDQAGLDACVTCGLCLPVCPTFRLTGDETASPRGRLTAMAAVGEGTVSADDRFGEMMSFCLQCRACETACPSLVPFGRLMEGARAEVEAQVPNPGRRRRRFTVVTALRSRWLLRLVTAVASVLQWVGLLSRVPVVGPAASGMRRIPFRGSSIVGTRTGSTSLPVAMVLSGCVADRWFDGLHQATVEVLVAAGYRVEVPSGQTCCGALAAHSGFADDAETMARVNAPQFANAARVVADVAGCGAHMANYGSYGFSDVAAKVSDINRVVVEAIADGRLPTLDPTGDVVGVQDPCHLEHGLRSHTDVDVVVRAAGSIPVPIDRGGLCCGAAGVYQLEHPGVSRQLGEAKAATVTSAGVATVVSANVGCEMQLRRFVQPGVEILHPVELYVSRLRVHSDWA